MPFVHGRTVPIMWPERKNACITAIGSWSGGDWKVTVYNENTGGEGGILCQTSAKPLIFSGVLDHQDTQMGTELSVPCQQLSARPPQMTRSE